MSMYFVFGGFNKHEVLRHGVTVSLSKQKNCIYQWRAPNSRALLREILSFYEDRCRQAVSVKQSGFGCKLYS